MINPIAKIFMVMCAAASYGVFDSFRAAMVGLAVSAGVCVYASMR